MNPTNSEMVEPAPIDCSLGLEGMNDRSKNARSLGWRTMALEIVRSTEHQTESLREPTRRRRCAPRAWSAVKRRFVPVPIVPPERHGAR